MIYSIAYSKSIDKVLKKWKKSNPVLFKKYSKLLEVKSVALQSEMQPLRSHTLHLQVRESSSEAQRYDYFPKYPRISEFFIRLR